jgi:hypothetical protein
MTTPNTDITAASAVSNFQTLIRDPVNNISGKWTSSSHPGGVAITGYPTLSSATPSTLASALLAGDQITTAPIASSIPAGDLNLATFRNILLNAASVLGQCRYATLNKYYGSGASWIFYNTQSNYAHLNSSYALAISTPYTSGDVSASVLDNYVLTLQTAVTNWRNTTVTFAEYWCHSNCHSNHSSRGRR